ncbi:cysteine desulfurase family protein [Streptococcus sp. 1001283B150225_161107_H12]|uniref:cysteine desulfurase family protein n=1 Tax=Streptococcus sp. 1001283B150225_161107_H12 TaxID=2787122 RepID=UPI00189BA795|nr:cysteine desulfurase family protein [Streptococcus sp. 1001283B150225_161107_H12]
MIYFDNAATTPLSPGVIKVMTETMETSFGNPSSLHSHGRQAKKILRDARECVATCLKTSSQQIIFTSGGTESNNTVIKGYCLKHRQQGKHIITTAIEHHAVLEPIEYLVQEYGFEVTIIQPVDQKIRPEDIRAALRPDTILVSTMYANNETGDLLPIKAISDLLKDHPAAFHVDAVQAVGKLSVAPEELGIDFLTASAHKFHGPKGVGILYARKPDFFNLLHGGDQEDKRRASTENLISIAGMAQALKEATDQLDANYQYIQRLSERILTGLEDLDFYLNSTGSKLPHVLNIGFPGISNDILLLRLDMAGISVSTGSACTAGTVQPSHVLAAYYGEDSVRLKESIRISLSEFNTTAEVDTYITTIHKILGELHGI